MAVMPIPAKKINHVDSLLSSNGIGLKVFWKSFIAALLFDGQAFLGIIDSFKLIFVFSGVAFVKFFDVCFG